MSGKASNTSSSPPAAIPSSTPNAAIRSSHSLYHRNRRRRLWCPQETVPDVVVVEEPTGDRLVLVHPRRRGAKTAARACARCVERGDLALLVAQKSVVHAVGVEII